MSCPQRDYSPAREYTYIPNYWLILGIRSRCELVFWLVREKRPGCFFLRRGNMEKEFSPLPLSPGKHWKRTKIKAQRGECWFYSLEAEKQLVKASLESSLLLGPKASVKEAVHLTHKGVWESEPLFLVYTMLGLPTPALMWTALLDDAWWCWCGEEVRERNMGRWELHFPIQRP